MENNPVIPEIKLEEMKEVKVEPGVEENTAPVSPAEIPTQPVVLKKGFFRMPKFGGSKILVRVLLVVLVIIIVLGLAIGIPGFAVYSKAKVLMADYTAIKASAAKQN
ncbi:MAG TPA: hypothetical protein VLE44_00210, partial [Candidatus Saccharimonadales bacterium]|nr:hypothetical protein [Candidatus Saccharimonadales bacterium]